MSRTRIVPEAFKTARFAAEEKAAPKKLDPVIKTMIGAGEGSGAEGEGEGEGDRRVEGTASPAPPLGPLLGQKGVNVATFCKDFNSKTAHIRDGVPLPVFITVNPDRSYGLEILSPHIPWLIKKCAGINLGSHEGQNEIFGKITLKHVYEIAKVKLEDPYFWRYDMKEMCQIVLYHAKTCGVKVERELDAAEYRAFLEARIPRLRERMQELEDLKAAKVMRTPVPGRP